MTRPDGAEQAQAQPDFPASHTAQECLRIRCSGALAGEYRSGRSGNGQRRDAEDQSADSIGRCRFHIDPPVIHARARSMTECGSNVSAFHSVERTVPRLP